MKRILLLFTIITALSITALASDKIISLEQLPKKSQELIAEFFANDKIVKITMDKELVDTEYEVLFASGTKIEFDYNGDWKEIKAKKSCIPSKILLPSIEGSIATNHPEACVEEVERDKKRIKVELSNGLEMIFNNKGKLIRYDD